MAFHYSKILVAQSKKCCAQESRWHVIHRTAPPLFALCFNRNFNDNESFREQHP